MQHQTHHTSASLASLCLTVIWLGCLAIGLTGLLVPLRRPVPQKHLSPLQATLIHVQLMQDATAAPRTPTPATPPPLTPPPPPLPPMVAIALPSPNLAHASPTSGPAKTPSEAEASAIQTSADAAPAVQHLDYQQVQGEQLKPEYPLEARIAHQQGTVLVQFIVGEDGRVSAAEVTDPCPFPLLNEAALRRIRDDWRFPPGPPRICDIPIEFKLTRK